MTFLDILRARVDRVVPLLGLLVVILIGYQISCYIYNIFFHPLRKFPGPKICAASSLPYVTHQVSGEVQDWLVRLHAKYGEVVRPSPNELSFSGADAWKDIYSHRKAGQSTLPKSRKHYAHPGYPPSTDIISGDDEQHSRMRRIFANAFSDRALKLQEPLFLTYINRLVDSLRANIEKDPNHHFNMVSMYNFTTFDVMGDLAFGEPLNLLTDTTYHPWIKSMFAGFKFGAYLHSIRYYPLLEKALMAMIPPSLEKKRKEHGTFSSARVDKRLEKKDARPDIWGLVLARDAETGLSREEMYSNASLFMLAGTETTATLLSGLTFHLLKNPETMAKLVAEIRGEFANDHELTIERLQALPYLHACIEEGFRMYPPVANGLPRTVPPTGAVIDGHECPPGIIVYVHALSSYRNPVNFKDAYKFIPERWISDSYASDKKHALQPFSIGPRNCLGKNMAYHEIRLILAKTLWNFDFHLCEKETGNFPDTKKIFIIWEKGPLWCTLTPVKR